jgi:hypothetical protein
MWCWAIAASLALIEPAIVFAQAGPEDNVEMATLFEADQETRRNATPDDYQNQDFVLRMIEEDETRRTQTQDLLAEGALATANDYYRAAFIFQHGGKPESYLLAHTLAVAAAARGHERAPWIAAATLDLRPVATGPATLPQVAQLHNWHGLPATRRSTIPRLPPEQFADWRKVERLL